MNPVNSEIKIAKIILLLIIVSFASGNTINGQTQAKPAAKSTAEQVKLYDPTLDGMKQLKDAAALAKKANKHVLIQYGGNWCSWCIKFDGFCKSDTSILRLINNNYIPVKLNYSPENRNDAANVYLGNPSRFGFPVFIVLDGNGKVLHIQDSGLLEEGQGYSRQKVTGFFRNWTAAAIVPQTPKK
jgi:thioredoxin-related protein